MEMEMEMDGGDWWREGLTGWMDLDNTVAICLLWLEFLFNLCNNTGQAGCLSLLFDCAQTLVAACIK